MTDEAAHFTSPLQVLLHLIEKEHTDITSVALAHVTNQYLAYLATLQTTSATLLADFLSVGSRLVLLKSRALASLPEEEEDLEEPLLDQLREYQSFRQAARALRELAERNGSSYVRRRHIDDHICFMMPPDLTTNDLRAAMSIVLEDIAAWDILPEDSIHDRISIREKIEELRSALQSQASFALGVSQQRNDTLHLLVGFLAVLEMVRRQEARVCQSAIGEDITVERL